MIIIGLGLLSVYFISIQRNIKNFKSIDLKEKLKMPNFGEEFKGLPKLEIPTSTEEELNKMNEFDSEELNKFDWASSAAKLEEEMQKNEEENQTSTFE